MFGGGGGGKRGHLVGGGGGGGAGDGPDLSCGDAKKLFYGALVLDGGFLLGGGAVGILRVGKAGMWAFKAWRRARPIVGKMEWVYARGNLVRGGQGIARAAGSRLSIGAALGYAIAGRGATDPGALWPPSPSGALDVILDAAPIIGSFRAWESMKLACG